jgi:hypothetical protein
MFFGPHGSGSIPLVRGVNVPLKSNKQKNLKVKDENSRNRIRIHWSEAWSADPDPYQNVTELCFEISDPIGFGQGSCWLVG